MCFLITAKCVSVPPPTAPLPQDSDFFISSQNAAEKNTELII